MHATHCLKALFVSIIYTSVLLQADARPCRICEDTHNPDADCDKRDGDQYELCAIEGRYRLVQHRRWQCDVHKNRYYYKQNKLVANFLNERYYHHFNELELHPSKYLPYKGPDPPTSYKDVQLHLPAKRIVDLGDACWMNGGHGRGCRTFHRHNETCGLLQGKGDTLDGNEGPSLCLRYLLPGKEKEQDDIYLSVVWAEPKPYMCHFHNDNDFSKDARTGMGGMKTVQPGFTEAHLTHTRLVVATKRDTVSEMETRDILYDKCPALMGHIKGAFASEYPYEGKVRRAIHKLERTVNSTRVAVLRNSMHAQQAKLVRLELYNWGASDTDNAQLFVSFAPQHDARTDAIFRTEHADRLVEAARACYEASHIKLVSVLNGYHSKETGQVERLHRVWGASQLWPHLQVEVKHADHSGDLNEMCRVTMALFGSWSHCYGDDKLQRPVITAHGRLGLDPRLHMPWHTKAYQNYLIKTWKDNFDPKKFKRAQSERLSAKADVQPVEYDPMLDPVVVLLGLASLAGVGLGLRAVLRAMAPHEHYANRHPLPHRFVPRLMQQNKERWLTSMKL